MMIKKNLDEFIKPIKERWVFHFLLSPKTSPLDKPEWYLDQTIKTIDQYLNKAERELGPEIKNDFILTMVECVMKRLKRDIKKISTGLSNPETELQNEAILIHTYNEVVSFICKCFKPLIGTDAYTKLDEKYDLMSFFSNQDLFERIVEVEWEHGNQQLANILEMPDPWSTVLDEEYQDEYKIPKRVDKLIMLLSAMKDRIECFRQEDCQFKLIELQCCLTERMLNHLKETARSSSRTSTIKNILNLPNSLLTSGISSTVTMPPPPTSINDPRTIAIKNGLNFLRIVLKGNHIVPDSVHPKLDYSLKDRLRSLSEECIMD